MDFHLKDYVGSMDRVRICPADPKGPARLTNNASSYVLNEYTAVDKIDPFGGLIESYRRVDALRNPCETMIVFLCSDRYSPNVFSDHTHSAAGAGWKGAQGHSTRPPPHG
jgi:hypothetical protein